MQENFLQKEKLYQIRFQSLTNYRGEGYSYYNFQTNSPPKWGTCVLDRSAGRAVLDEFQLQCNNWTDNDFPLTYQVNIPKLDGTYIVFAAGPNSSIPLRLPVGNKDDGYRLRLEVVVIDSLLASTRVNMSAIVSINNVYDLYFAEILKSGKHHFKRVI